MDYNLIMSITESFFYTLIKSKSWNDMNDLKIHNLLYEIVLNKFLKDPLQKCEEFFTGLKDYSCNLK